MDFDYNIMGEKEKPGIKALYEAELETDNKPHRVRANIVYECSDCPLPTSSRDVNLGDKGEGFYTCPILNKEVWGEGPECDYAVFQMLARALLNYIRG